VGELREPSLHFLFRATKRLLNLRARAGAVVDQYVSVWQGAFDLAVAGAGVHATLLSVGPTCSALGGSSVTRERGAGFGEGGD
jgi:hypothetical protein